METTSAVGRANWGSQVEFILTLIGFAVGLGNVWRFPYLCFRNGGGAFLVPYFLSLFFMGIPLFFMELSFGQFASLGPIKIWIFNPAMKGLGYSMVIVSGMIAIYYNVIIAVCMFYFFASMTSKLPWSNCDDFSWASCYCRSYGMNSSEEDPWNTTRPECVSLFSETSFDPSMVKNPSEEYFYKRVLRRSPNLAEMGTVQWDLTLCLLFAWLIVFVVLTKGIESLGKIVYVTSTFPYIILTILLVRSVTLDGYKEGILFYLTPDLSKLQEANVWSDAAVQIFFSLSVCSGGLIAMASYNEFHNNVMRDGIIVPIINCLTSFYAGFVIFSTLGFMAHNKNVAVSEVAVGGPGLAFIAYPEALAQMPVAPLWSILFFIMMMMLGFSSQFSIVETVLTGLADEFPFLTRSRTHATAFRFCSCMLGFVLGLPLVTRSGFHLLDLVDNATGGFPLLIVGLIEIITIMYIYGYKKFHEDVEMMIGDHVVVKALFIYFAPMWCFFTPAGLLVVVVFKSIQYVPKSVTSGDIYQSWADAIWWLIILAAIICIPIWFVMQFCKDGGFKVMMSINKPRQQWGPALKINQTGRYRSEQSSAKTNVPNGYDRSHNENHKNGQTNEAYTSDEINNFTYL